MITPIAFFGGNLGGGEMVLLFVIALLLFGAKNLPKIARNLGRSMEEFRRAAREVKDEVMRADQEYSSPPPQRLTGGEPRAAKNDEPDGAPGETPGGATDGATGGMPGDATSSTPVSEPGEAPGSASGDAPGEGMSGEGERHENG
jgi:sec-independent protein translocase protein TatA